MSVPVKKIFNRKLLLNLQGYHTFQTFCTVDSTPCTVTESNIHAKLCKVHMKSVHKLKKVHIEDLQYYFSLYTGIEI